MSTNDAFGAIVQRFETKPQIDTASQTLVTVEIEGGFLWKRYAYYVVNHDKSGRASARGRVIVPLEEHARGWTLSLRLDYHASAAKDSLPTTVAERIVKSLGTMVGPQATFERRLHDSVVESVLKVGGLGRLVQAFESVRTDLVREIQQRVSRDTGLDVSIRLAVNTDSTFQKIKTIKDEFPTELSDYQGPLKVIVHIDLEAIDGQLPHVHQNRLGELCAEVTAFVRRYARSLTLQQVHFEADKIEQSLRERISAMTKEQGRIVSLLSFHCPSPVTQPIQRTQRIAPAAFVFDRVEYPRPIRVECELQAQLVEIGKYVRSGLPDLNAWSEQKFKEVIERHLLAVSYIELFLKPTPTPGSETGFAVFDRKIDETKKAMQQEAQGIGYEAYSVALRTDLDFDELRKEFRVALVNETFEMNVPDYKAGLDVEVRARIDNEDVIRNLFRRNVNIKGVIEGEIRETVRQGLKTISPEQYYVHFREEGRPAGISVTEGLRQQISKMLKSEYRADVTSVTCTPRLTDLAKLFDDLKREHREISFTLERSHLTFKCVFRVKEVSLEHWNEFQSTRPGMERVETMVRDSITEWLTQLSRDELIGAADMALKAALNQEALQAAKRELGLGVEIVHLARLKSPEEGDLLEKTVSERKRRIVEFEEVDRTVIDGLKGQLKGLIAQAAALAEAGAFEDLEAINLRMVKISEDIRQREKVSPFSVTVDVVAEAGLSGRAALRAASGPKRLLTSSNATSGALPAGRPDSPEIKPQE